MDDDEPPSLAWLFGARRALLDDPAPFSADGQEELTELQFTIYLTVSICLVIMAGLMSGLTLGLMSLDTVELEVLKRSGTPEERRCAAVIMPVIRNQHFLLVTLLLCNAASTEALPLFIDRLADPFTAVLVSVTSVLVFGEIIPQAICSRYGLKVGAYSAWFVRSLMYVCSPIAWPIGKLLDFLLGSEHSALFRRAQLKALVDVHSSSAGFGGTLSEQEIAVIRGALDLTSKTADKSMTPLDKVFMLSSEDRLDERTMQAILLSGHSRIPVYRDGNRKDILGLILSKELVLIDPSDHLAVSQLKIRQMPHLSADTPMYDMLKLFETGKSHMALLTRSAPGGTPTVGNQDIAKHAAKQPLKPSGGNVDQSMKRMGMGSFRTTSFSRHGNNYYGKDDDLGAYGITGYTEDGVGEPIGIITIEDVIEELLQEEIIDETDLFVDNLQATRVNAAEVTGTLPPRVQRMLNAGLFTPRVGRLGAPQKSMPPGMPDDMSAPPIIEDIEMPLHTADVPLYGNMHPLDAVNPLGFAKPGQPLASVKETSRQSSATMSTVADPSATATAGSGRLPSWMSSVGGHQSASGGDKEVNEPLLSLSQGQSRSDEANH